MPHKNSEDRRKWQREWRAKNKDKVLEQQRRYEKRIREEKREHVLETKRKYYEKNKHKYRFSWKKSKYGISETAFNKILKLQQNSCAACKLVFGEEKFNKPHIDHYHKTGIVRGLLCFHCNITLGRYMDNPMVLRNLAKYLEDQDGNSA